MTNTQLEVLSIVLALWAGIAGGVAFYAATFDGKYGLRDAEKAQKLCGRVALVCAVAASILLVVTA